MTQIIHLFFFSHFYKKKVIIIPFYNLGLGGIQTKIIDLANELIKRERIEVLLVLQEKTPFDRNKALSDSVNIVYCPQFFPSLVKNRYHYLIIFILIVLKPFSVFTSLEDTSLFVAKYCKRLTLPTKVVVNIDTYFKAEQRVSTQIVKQVFSKADVVLAVSHATYSDLKSRIGLTTPPLTYFPNWTLIHKQKVIPYDKKEIDIVFLGRFEDQKNPEEIVNFAKLTKKYKHPVTIHMYGEGFLKKKIREKIQKEKLEGVIKIFDFSHNIKPLLEKSRFLIVTSKYEGLSFSMLEAMAYGIPILALHAPGVTELVQNRKTGVVANSITELFDEYVKLNANRNAYAEMQRNTIAEQKEKYGRKALKNVIEILISQ